MKLTTILFDLDGTLLPMDNDEFTRGYFKLLAAKMAPLGYEPKRLVDAVWTGTAAMVKNDGSRSNETAFWQAFGQIYGDRAQADRPIFEAFYENEFQNARAICGFDPAAAQSVRELKRSGFGVALGDEPDLPGPSRRRAASAGRDWSRRSSRSIRRMKTPPTASRTRRITATSRSGSAWTRRHA